jgi:adenylate cyclase
MEQANNLHSKNTGNLQRKRTVSISVLVPIILAALIIAAIVPVALVGYLGTQDVSRRLLRDRSELLTEAVVGPIQNLLTPISTSMDAAAGELSKGTVSPDSQDQFNAFIQGVFAASDHISSISVVALDGSLKRWSHNGENGATDDEGLKFREQLIANAAAGGDGTWSSPFLSNANKELVVTYRTPIRSSGQLTGLLTAAVSLNSISEALQSIREEFDVVPFLLSGRDRVVAHPDLSLPQVQSVPSISTVNDPVMAAIWADQNPLNETDSLRNGKGHWSIVNGVSYTYIYRSLQLGKGADLVAGYYMPSVTTRRDRLMRYYVAGWCGLLLVGACVAAAQIGRRLAKPVRAFGDASIAIGEFRFQDFDLQNLSRSRVREIADTASALTRMSKGVELFQRYVPRMLVRQLITLGDKSSRPSKREMTVLFLDLEGYTRYSTGRNADEVASYLNAMFGRIGPIIEASGGTIDKYTGDGLMAFWGAPAEDPDHARNALSCAFEIAQTLSVYLLNTGLTHQDMCRIRMGIHSGEMVVGDLGYDGRIDYTVVGEVVNRAKRVESALRGLAPEKPVVVAVTEETLQSAGSDAKIERRETLSVGNAWRVERLP